LPEFARIANLVRQSFEQRETLRHEIEERARLGRDLHDGVIQNLYATGLGLAQAQRLATNDPAGAVLRLEQTRQTLNQTMEALRGFIARAEPEASGPVDFTDACVTLFQTLRAGRACELDLNVDTEVAARLPAGTQASLLLIVREAISNALRHGDARHVEISLRLDEAPDALAGRACLRVHDDGCGFALVAQKGGGGRGLDNIRARARELGGAAEFVSSPGCGLDLIVRWPWAKLA
jgi:signal transduction histidine kinase